VAKSKADYVAEGRAIHASGGHVSSLRTSWQERAKYEGWRAAEVERTSKVVERKAKSAEKFGKERRVYADARRRCDATIAAVEHRLRMNAL